MEVLRRKSFRYVYECPLCQLPFTRRGQVKEHAMTVHGFSAEKSEEMRQEARRWYEEIASVVRYTE